jgi:hypothetical protein
LVEPVSATRIINLSSGEQTQIDEMRGIKMTTKRVDHTITEVIRDPKSDCLLSLTGAPVLTGESILGREMFSGYSTVKIKSAASSLTWWFALDFGCALVRSQADWSGRGATHQEVVALTGGEPSAGLFDVAAGLREAMPSEFYGNDGLSKDQLARMDDWYLRNRP